MTDNDIKKALKVFYKEDNDMLMTKSVIKGCLDLINRLEKENTDLFYKLAGVMHSVDKWLEGDELKQDEVNRAATMREKTLQITEKQSAEIEKLNVELVGMRGACESYRIHYDVSQAEIERLKKRSILNGLKVVNKERKQIKSEAIKELAERLKKDLYSEIEYVSMDVVNSGIDNLVKEMTEGKE